MTQTEGECCPSAEKVRVKEADRSTFRESVPNSSTGDFLSGSLKTKLIFPSP